MAQHSFWVIVDGQTPTSFRSRQQEDLLPTLTQLKRTQPDVRLMWFERGRLWASPDEARAALIAKRSSPTGRPRAWRPGGDHKDPRAKYDISRDERRARFKARHERDRRDGGAPPHREAPPQGEGDRPFRPRGDRPFRPHGDRPPFRRDRPERQDDRAPFRPRPGGDRSFRSRNDRPRDDRPRGDRPYRDRPQGDRPHGDRPRSDRPHGKPPFGKSPFGGRPRGDRPPSGSGRPPRDEGSGPPAPRGAFGSAPGKFGKRPWRPKKPGQASRPWQPGRPWRPKKRRD